MNPEAKACGMVTPEVAVKVRVGALRDVVVLR